MKIKDLIKDISAFDSELEVDLIANSTNHTCGADEYCYCSNEDNIFEIQSFDREFFKSGKNKDKIKRILIRGKEGY